MTRLAELMSEALTDARKVYGKMILCAGLNKNAERTIAMERAIYYWQEAIKAEEEPELRHRRD